RRSGPEVLALARVVSVLGPDSTVDRLSRLVHRKPADVKRSLQVLRTVGCLNGNDFQDPAFREAVVDCMEPADLAELHASAARVLHADEAGTDQVARHLIAAGGESDDWMIEQLLRAAKEGLGADNVGRAVEYLEYALAGHADGPQAAALRILLLRAEMRVSLATADRHLPRLCEHERAGELDTEQRVFLLHCLLWAGRDREAEPVLDRLGQEYRNPQRHPSGALTNVGHWLRHAYLELAKLCAEVR